MEQLVDRLPDEDAVRELVRHLKGAPHDVALRTIRNVLELDSRPKRIAGLVIARRVLREEADILPLLEVGLARKDVSEVQYWLDMVCSTAGHRRLLKHLLKLAPNEPEWIVHAWYQLVPMIRTKAPGLAEKLVELQQTTDAALESKAEDLKAFWLRTKEAVIWTGSA